MLELQKFLLSGGTIAQLEEKYAIKSKRHGRFNELVLFKYDQIESSFAEKIVREARGIILNEAKDWKVVSRALDKFFNHLEGHAAEIDWSSAKCQEKCDGSLITVYPFKGQWHVQTSGMPDASGEINTYGLPTWEPRPGITWDVPKSFADFFWQVLRFYYQDTLGNDTNLIFKRVPEINICFFFEITSLLNRVVVRNNEAGLTLLGARNLDTQEEIAPEDAFKILNHAIPVVKTFPLQTMDQILESFSAMDPLIQEGYVIVDKYFNRIKVKHAGYIALHHAKDGMGTKAFVEIARSGETSEVESAFPEFKSMLEEARNRLSNLIKSLEEDYERLKDIVEQKEFAIRATKESTCSTALFQVRSGKAKSIKEFIRNMRIESLLMLLGYKEK